MVAKNIKNSIQNCKNEKLSQANPCRRPKLISVLVQATNNITLHRDTKDARTSKFLSFFLFFVLSLFFLCGFSFFLAPLFLLLLIFLLIRKWHTLVISPILIYQETNKISYSCSLPSARNKKLLKLAQFRHSFNNLCSKHVAQKNIGLGKNIYATRNTSKLSLDSIKPTITMTRHGTKIQRSKLKRKIEGTNRL